MALCGRAFAAGAEKYAGAEKILSSVARRLFLLCANAHVRFFVSGELTLHPIANVGRES
jgi:hypothetical protein